MEAFHSLMARGDVDKIIPSSTMIDLMIALFALVLLGLVLIATLFFLRDYRRKQKAKNEGLPLYSEKPSIFNHRRLTITATPYGGRPESFHIYNEKQQLMKGSSTPPFTETIPEIRITFPEEEDASGRRKSGRVVIVRVGDSGVGLEPVHDDNLPPYQKSDSGQFYSVDLDRVGGLKEKI